MKNSYSILSYKWQHGILSLQDMINLVKKRQLTVEQFFKITRYNYIAMAQKLNIQTKKI